MQSLSPNLRILSPGCAFFCAGQRASQDSGRWPSRRHASLRRRETVEPGRIVYQNGLFQIRLWRIVIECVQQVPVVRHETLQRRVRPVATPDHVPGARLDERARKRNDILVGWARGRNPVIAGELDPADAVLNQFKQRPESGVVDAMCAGLLKLARSTRRRGTASMQTGCT